MIRLTIFLAVLVSVAMSFQTSMPVRNIQQKTMTSPIVRHVILSDEETEKIMISAEECAEGECSIDDVAGLIADLQEQQKEMEQRLEKIMNMVASLQHLNEKEDRSENEVRSFVKDLLRVFALHTEPKKASFTPVGFSGDIGSGSTTAYDALPPKKWTP